jgi:TetR/AcrR family transcriptional regulator
MKRRPAEDPDRRAAILDATEALILDKGYAAASTRQVARRAGLAAGLIHYYYPTTDDLLVALYRRLSSRTSELQKDALLSERPLHALWKLNVDAKCTALTVEFMAMANHRPIIRAEIARSIRDARKLQIDALSRRPFNGCGDMRDPLTLTVVTTSIARLLVMENALGISLGHRDARDLAEHWVATLEPRSSKAGRARGRTTSAQREA